MTKNSLRYFFFVATCIILTLLFTKQFEEPVSAQLSGCPKQLNDPNTGLPLYGWQRTKNGATSVKYFIDQPAFDEFQKGKLREAFTKWNAASSTTCLRINFTETQTESQAKLAIYSTTQGSTRTDYVDVDEVTRVLKKAFISINKTEFVENGPNYNTVYLKAGLHEIGHTMGLDHPENAFVAGVSVMNGRSGVNDSQNITATEIQPCDKQSINENPQCSAPTPTPTPPVPPSGGCLPPEVGGTCLASYFSNGCGHCCSEAAQSSCYSQGWVFNLNGGDCRDPQSLCYEQQTECPNPQQYWSEFGCRCAFSCEYTSPILIDVSSRSQL